jgi:hypothetical protein
LLLFTAIAVHAGASTRQAAHAPDGDDEAPAAKAIAEM